MRNKLNYFLAHAFWILLGVAMLAYGVHAIYSAGYQAGCEKSSSTELIIHPVSDDGSYDVGYDDGHHEGYKEGYDEGFNSASTAIIDTMDPEYRQKWWDANIDMIIEMGIGY